MEKVICDICGSEFDESLSQCPICGCAKKETAVDPGETAYVKGGRFSKSNVRRRMKPETGAAASESVREYVRNNDDRVAERMAAKPEPEEDEPRSNRPLLLVVILLLLAIIAVSVYIVIAFSEPSAPADSSTNPTTIVTAPKPDVGCTAVTFTEDKIVLNKQGAEKLLMYFVEPENSKEKVSFESSDPSIVSVDADGKVTALQKGTVTITISCGSCSDTITVVSEYEKPTLPPTTQPTTQPTINPTLPQNSQFTIPGGAVAVAGYKIKITYAGGGVNIRQGPGTKYAKVNGQAFLDEQYDVYAIYDDPEREWDWALTDKGWITLQYAQKIS